MKIDQLRLSIAAAILISTSALMVCIAPLQAASGDDSAAVKHVIQGFTDAFNQHDSHAVGMWFTDDADFTNVTQDKTHGRTDIEQHFVPLFAGRLKDAHRTYTIKNIRFIRPDVATVQMDYVLTGALDRGGAPTPARKGIYDWIVSKQDGKWLINVFHESELGTAAPAVVPVR